MPTRMCIQSERGEEQVTQRIDEKSEHDWGTAPPGRAASPRTQWASGRHPAGAARPASSQTGSEWEMRNVDSRAMPQPRNWCSAALRPRRRISSPPSLWPTTARTEGERQAGQEAEFSVATGQRLTLPQELRRSPLRSPRYAWEGRFLEFGPVDAGRCGWGARVARAYSSTGPIDHSRVVPS